MKGANMTAMSKAFLSSVLALPWLLAGCGQQAGEAGAGAAAVDEDSPAYQAYEYRHGLMHVIGFKMGRIRAMSEGDLPADDAVLREYANDLSALATMITEGFPEGSGVTGSRALPDIWQNWGDFEQKAQDFESATVALADAADSGTVASAQSAIQNTAQACGGCHRPYRAEEG
jgi:cytochrome c556